jgi:hypothetical protein
MALVLSRQNDVKDVTLDMCSISGGILCRICRANKRARAGRRTPIKGALFTFLYSVQKQGSLVILCIKFF